jgi:hypothetical protein
VLRPQVGCLQLHSAISTDVSTAIASGIHELPSVFPDALHADVHALDVLHSFIIR